MFCPLSLTDIRLLLMPLLLRFSINHHVVVKPRNEQNYVSDVR